MPYTLPKLPYDEKDLQPYMSEIVVRIHYHEHTKGYFSKLNELIRGTIFADTDDLGSLITRTNLLQMDTKLFNNACQAWNHVFFWNGMCKPSDDNKPSEELLTQISHDFGTVEKFKEAFTEKAVSSFGSGWTWLILQHGKLQIKSTPNAENPLRTANAIPLLVIDTWEHAYYMQYPADRATYVANWWNVINWKKVNELYAENV